MTIGEDQPSAVSTDPSPPPFDPRRRNDLAPGRLVAGRYEILACLGSGGMSTVWRARDHDLGEDVALKVLHPGPDQTSRDFSALRREALLARRITHKNVCRTHDAGQDGDLRFLTMELAHGAPLRALIRRGPVPPELALDILIQLAEGLRAAHAGGIIHRDLKPENVLLGNDGRVIILDFGLASSVAQEPTCSRAFAGTPGYMSPEQLRGLPLDTRTDIFSAGVIAHELLSGRHPFGDGPPATVTSAILRDRPAELAAPWLPLEVRAALRGVLAQAMAKRPEDRFHRVADFIEALTAALRDLWSSPEADADIVFARTGPTPLLRRGRPGGTRWAFAGLIALELATPALSEWHIAAPAPATPAPDESDTARCLRERRRGAENGTTSAAARSKLLQFYDLVGPAPGPEHVRAGVTLLDEALAEDPRYAPALLDKAALLAVDASAGGRPSEEQLGLIDQALRIDPSAPRAWVMRCDRMQRATQEDGRPTDARIDAAFEACKQAQIAAPSSGAVHLSVARLHDLSCQDGWAILSLETALRLDPSLAGRVLEHELDLQLQRGNLFAADDISRRLVEIHDEDRALGARSPRIRAGAPPPRAAYLLRAGVLIRLGRLPEARAALERDLAEIDSNPGEWWTEASAIRGLLRVARMQGDPEPEPLHRRLGELEERNRREVEAGSADRLLLPCAYRSTDPAAGAELLRRAPAPATFLTALAHAVLYHMADDDAGAREALALFPPDPSQRWETECAAKVEDALSD